MNHLTRTTTQRVFITRTEGEWEAIEQKITELGKTDINCYLRSKIFQLCKQIDAAPETVTSADGERIKKQHCIPSEVYEKLEILSIRMKRPIGSIVDELIIAPLLNGGK